jgi:hypothetical protein
MSRATAAELTRHLEAIQQMLDQQPAGSAARSSLRELPPIRK